MGRSEGSLTVENVHSLSMKNTKELPTSFLRVEGGCNELVDVEALEIPVIDMSKLVIGQSGYEDEREKLHLACKDWGFFQLINHGALAEIENVKVVTEDFFNLPLEEKVACARLPNSVEGYGQAYVISDNPRDPWADMLFLVSLPLSKRNIDLWPKTPTTFRPTLDEYSAKLKQLSVDLLRLMAENLKVEPQKIINKFVDGNQGMRLNYYPPCSQQYKAVGLTPHSDATGLTLLIQVNDVQGLQIKKNQKWVPVNPIPGAIIINIGDVMEVLSNGEYRSIEHRVVMNNKRERLSIAAFHSPNMESTVGPVEDLVKEIQPKFKTISHGDLIKLIMNSKLDGKRLLDQLKIC